MRWSGGRDCGFPRGGRSRRDWYFKVYGRRERRKRMGMGKRKVGGRRRPAGDRGNGRDQLGDGKCNWEG